MMKSIRFPALLRGFAFAALVLIARPWTLADEGMWLFNAPPRALLREKHNFEPTDAWLQRLQKASVRFNSGGSGSFISEDGLVISNHHVGADALQKLGDEKNNLLRDGFHARSLAEERRCHDLELNVLVSIEDVTARINASVQSSMAPAEAFAARRAAIATIEKESLDATGLRSDVVTLFQGGAYHLYRYKKYTDVRLVFAPEQQVAFFGGDPDNFEYPRFNLDICFFRAYENDKPAHTPDHLKFNAAGPDDNDLVFVSGHPGRTSRLLTMAETEYLRDQSYPMTLRRLHRLEVILNAYSERSAENARRAKDDLFGVQNSRKARQGMLAGLLDPEFMRQALARESHLRQQVANHPDWQSTAAAWDKIASAQKEIARHATRYQQLEGAGAVACKSFEIARTLLRSAEERAKPNNERLREFTDAGKESLEFSLFSTEPIYEDLEELKLTQAITFAVELLGWNDPIIQTILAGQSPSRRASELIRQTRVRDVAVRKALYAGGSAALSATKDPMIELARSLDAESRSLRTILEAQGEIKQQAHAQIAKARFALQQKETYPDATFTLRLAFGLVKGYREAGRDIPHQTTMAGLYQRAEEQRYREPFDLPKRWLDQRRRLNLKTPFNFVCTADIIGGNSGSPVVNRNGEFVGIIFDGNIQSLVLDHAFTEEQARAVSVHASSIIESLRQVYRAKSLVDEILGNRRPKA